MGIFNCVFFSYEMIALLTIPNMILFHLFSGQKCDLYLENLVLLGGVTSDITDVFQPVFLGKRSYLQDPRKNVSRDFQEGRPTVFFLKFDVLSDKNKNLLLPKMTTGSQGFPLTISILCRLYNMTSIISRKKIIEIRAADTDKLLVIFINGFLSMKDRAISFLLR